MTQHETVCACGRDAIDAVRVVSEDGLLLIPVCAECVDDPVAEQSDLFDATPRRPLSAMPARDDARQPPLPLDDATDEDRDAA
jgi:hypothetical protein